ncbi:MAG: hypothetical protein HQK93_03490, partial [Nitrospirae bacterium]|nr:hypothetical protein [Nitrospirota bacterium]
VSSTIVEVINLLYEQIIKSSILISLNGITAENIKADGIVSDILVTGYPNEFKQVVLNILTNARDAIIERRNRGLIKDNEKGLIEIEILNNNDMTIIKFKDNGGGIPEELISRVFDQYFTSKKDGTGIGLYMSKQIIEKNMEGRLSVENID